MSSLARDRRSGAWKARKAIPAALRSDYARAYGRGWEEKFTAAPTLSESQARVAHAEWLASVEARLNVVAAQARGEGVDLTQKQAHALAGRWYVWKTELHSDDPGAACYWAGEIVGLLASILAQDTKAPAQLSVSPARTALAPSVSELIARLGAAQSLVIEQCADLANADVFLARERLALSVADRRAFLSALISEVVAAHALLGRRAGGDHSPDQRPQRFPEWPCDARGPMLRQHADNLGQRFRVGRLTRALVVRRPRHAPKNAIETAQRKRLIARRAQRLRALERPGPCKGQCVLSTGMA